MMASDNKFDTGLSNNSVKPAESVTILYDDKNNTDENDADFEHTVQHHILRTTATIPRSTSSTIADATPSPSGSSASPRQPEIPGFISSSNNALSGSVPNAESGTFDSHIQAHVAAVTRGAEYRRRRSVSGGSRDRSRSVNNDKEINNVQITTVTKVKTHNLKQKSVATDTLSLPGPRLLTSSGSSRSVSPASPVVVPPLILSPSSSTANPQRLAPLATGEHDEDDLLTVNLPQPLRPSPVIAAAYRRTSSSSSSTSAFHTRTNNNTQLPPEHQPARHLRQHLMAQAAKKQQQNRLEASPSSAGVDPTAMFLNTNRASRSVDHTPRAPSPSRYLINALAHGKGGGDASSNIAQKALEKLAERQLLIINDIHNNDHNDDDDKDDLTSVTAPPTGHHLQISNQNSLSSPSSRRTPQQQNVGITVTKTFVDGGGPNVADSVLKRLLDRTPRNSISLGSSSGPASENSATLNSSRLEVSHDHVLRHRAHSGDETKADKNQLNERRASRLSRAWERISHSARSSPKRQQKHHHLQQAEGRPSSPSASIAEATLGKLLMRTPRHSVSGRARGSSGGSLATETVATGSSSSSSQRRQTGTVTNEPLPNQIDDITVVSTSEEPPLLHQQIMTALRQVANEQQHSISTESIQTTPKRQLQSNSPHSSTVANAKLRALLHHTPRHSFSGPSGGTSLSPSHGQQPQNLNSTTVTTTSSEISSTSKHDNTPYVSPRVNLLSGNTAATVRNIAAKTTESNLPGTVIDSRTNSTQNVQHKISNSSVETELPPKAKFLRHIDSEDVTTLRSDTSSLHESNAFLTSNDSVLDTPSNARRTHLLNSEKAACDNNDDDSGEDVADDEHEVNLTKHYDEPPPLETNFDDADSTANKQQNESSAMFAGIIPPLNFDNQSPNASAADREFSHRRTSNAVPNSYRRESLPAHSPFAPEQQHDEADFAAVPHQSRQQLHRASVDTVKNYQQTTTNVTKIDSVAHTVHHESPIVTENPVAPSTESEKRPAIVFRSVQISSSSTTTTTHTTHDTQTVDKSARLFSIPLYQPQRSRQASTDMTSPPPRLPPIFPSVLSPEKSSTFVVQGSKVPSNPTTGTGFDAHSGPSNERFAFLPSLSNSSSPSRASHRSEQDGAAAKHSGEHTSSASPPTAAYDDDTRRRPSSSSAGEGEPACQQQQQKALTTNIPNPSIASVDFFRLVSRENDDDDGDMSSQRSNISNAMTSGNVINNLTTNVEKNEVVNQHSDGEGKQSHAAAAAAGEEQKKKNNVVLNGIDSSRANAIKRSMLNSILNKTTKLSPTTKSEDSLSSLTTSTFSASSDVSSSKTATTTSPPPSTASSKTTTTLDYSKTDVEADNTANDVPPLLLHSQFAQHLFKPPPPIERIYSLGEIKRHSHDTLSMKAAIIAGLPSVETLEACDKAAERLKEVARLLTATPATTYNKDGTVNGDENHHGINNNDKGSAEAAAKALQVQLPNGSVSLDYLHTSILYAAQVLEALYRNEARMRTMDEDEFTADEIAAMPVDVRTWLQTTFTKHDEKMKKANASKPRFKGVARAIKAGITVDSDDTINCQVQQQFSVDARQRVDNWEFDIFEFHELSGGHSLRFIASYVMSQYGMLQKFRINPTTLENFLLAMEAGYGKYGNPYHNAVHAADVVQTMHYIITQANLNNWITELELFATIISAIIHDFEHSGTTNSFHIMTDSDLALLYNDKTVLESYHLSAAFRLVREKPDCNVFSNMAKEDYRLMRALVIDMVLATDMSLHAQKVKEAKTFIKQPDVIDRSKVLGYVLHACDISHGAKPWLSHNKWSELIFAEYFAQGDRERELGIAISALCDRSKILLPQSQIGYIDYVVEPTWVLCGDLVECVLAKHYNEDANNGDGEKAAPTANEQRKLSHQHHQQARIRKPWSKYIADNKQRWQERVASDVDEAINNTPKKT